MPVKFKLEAGGRIHSECPCITNQKYGQVCPHVVAIGLALTILEMDEDPPVSSLPSHVLGDEGLETEDGRREAEESKFIEVPIAPKFYALVSGSRAALSIELDC